MLVLGSVGKMARPSGWVESYPVVRSRTEITRNLSPNLSGYCNYREIYLKSLNQSEIAIVNFFKESQTLY